MDIAYIIIVQGIAVSLIMFCSVFWIVYVYRQARKMYRMHSQAVKLSQTNRDTEIYQFIGKYKTQYIKNVFMLVSLLLESYSGVGYLVHKILPSSDIILEYTNNPEVKLNICHGTNLTEYEDLSNFQWFDFTRIILESSHLCLALTSAICVALMKLVIADLKFNSPWERTKKSAVRNITVCTCLCALVLLLTLISYTWILARIISVPILIVYYVLFVRETKKLQAALAQYSRERLVQFGKNRRAENQLFKFKIMSNMLCIGLTLVIASITYEKVIMITSLILYYGQCYVFLTFHIQYIPILHSVSQQLILIKVLFYGSLVKLVLGVLIGLIIGVPYVLVSIMYIGYLVYTNYIRRFKTRFSYEDFNKNLLKSNYY